MIRVGIEPAWIEAGGTAVQAATSIGALWWGVRGARDEAARKFAQLVDEMLGLPTGEIVELLGNDRIAEIVGGAWDAAARTASEQKRWTLAKVAVVALGGGGDDAEIDPLPLLLRTVQAIDEPHVRLLVLIATPRPGKGQLVGSTLEGSYTTQDILEEWPQAAELLQAMLTTLEGEGLIRNMAAGTYNAGEALSLTPYGRRFLSFLPDYGTADLDSATLVAVPGSPQFVTIRNLGPADAVEVDIVAVMYPDGQGARQLMEAAECAGRFGGPSILAVGETWAVHQGHVGERLDEISLRVRWDDRRGEQEEELTFTRQ